MWERIPKQIMEIGALVKEEEKKNIALGRGTMSRGNLDDRRKGAQKQQRMEEVTHEVMNLLGFQCLFIIVTRRLRHVGENPWTGNGEWGFGEKRRKGKARKMDVQRRT